MFVSESSASACEPIVPSAMFPSDPKPEFARLLHEFPVARTAALQLPNPNHQDDDDIKLAIVGLAYHQGTEHWSSQHYEIIRARCEGELSDAELQWEGNAAGMFRAFACLALGALLGMRDANVVDDRGFSFGDALVPGFMYLHLPAIHHLGGGSMRPAELNCQRSSSGVCEAQGFTD